jgi:hypothetical protein
MKGLFKRRNQGKKNRIEANRTRLAIEGLEDRLLCTVSFQPQFGAETRLQSSGPVLSSTPVYLIFEGHYWQRPDGLSYDDVINRVNDILGSHFLSGLRQYGSDGFAYLAGYSFDYDMPTTTDSSGTTWFNESDLANTAALHFQNQFNVPNLQPLYFVVTAPGISDATRSGLAGYHTEQTYQFSAGFLSIPEQIPFGWTGVFGANRANQTDHFSQIFSHEVAEAISDPYLHTNPAVQVYHGTSWNSDESYDEISDFEPDAYTYVIRLSNGAIVQPYWSVSDQAYIVPDGNAQLFTLTPKWTDGSFQGTYSLTINGDQLRDPTDRMTIEAVSSGPDAGGLRVTLNGEAVNFAPGSITAITFNSGTGADLVNVDSLSKTVKLTLNMGRGQDSVGLAATSGSMDSVQGQIIVNGSGTTNLTVNDSAIANTSIAFHSILYSIDGGTLERRDNFSTFASARPNLILTDVSFSALAELTIRGPQTGAEFDILGDSAPLDIETGINPNRFVLGDSNHTLDDLVAPVTLNGHAQDSLVLDDRALTSPAGYTDAVIFDIRPFQIVRTHELTFTDPFGPITLTNTETISFVGIANLTIEGGPTGNTFNVGGTSAVTRIDAGLGVDTINVGNDAATLDDLQGALTIADAPDRQPVPGPDQDAIVINDAGNTTVGQQYAFFTGRFTRAGASDINFASTSYGLVRVLCGSGGVDFNLSGFDGTEPVDLMGGPGTDTLHGPALVNDWTVTGPDSGRINGTITYSSFETIVRNLVQPGDVVVGAGFGSEPIVNLYGPQDLQTGKPRFSFLAYDASFTGGVRVLLADINGDGVPDIVTAPAGVQVTATDAAGNALATPIFDFSAGMAPEVRVFSGVDGHLLEDFQAYNSDPSEPWTHAGIFIASADFNGDGKADIVTAWDATGMAAHDNVRVFFGGNSTGVPDHEFAAYNAAFAGGVRIAAGDVTGDGVPDIVTAPGIWSGPDIRIFDGTQIGNVNPDGGFAPGREFLAYDYRYYGGVNVAIGDLNGDGRPDIILGTDGHGGPEVKAVDAALTGMLQGSSTPIFQNGAEIDDAALLAHFNAFDDISFAGGVRVGFVSDLNGDGRGDILAAAGERINVTSSALIGPEVRAFSGLGINQAPLDDFFAFDPALQGGVFIGGS